MSTGRITTMRASPASSGLSARWFRWLDQPTHEISAVTAFFLLLTLVVFGPVLFGPGDQVLSNVTADLALQFIHWREFGFEQLKAGHLALWDPHIYAGTQYFGGFQSALLYPPNWLYLCLPLPRAINIGIALHVFLAGMFMYLWVRQRGLHVLSCILAGVVFMFGGPYFLHIYAGHLPNLCTMAWGPVIFLAIDGWLARRTSSWLLLGSGAVALQIFAGHPQYVFYTGIAAGLYCVPQLARAPRRWQAAAGLGIMVLAAVALSAVQLLEGFHAAGESIRSKGTNIAFAAVFSFPPENLLTLVVPGFFGDMFGQYYWGRCFLWEMSVFFGISGLILATYALIWVRKADVWVCAGLVTVLLVLALGHNTPFFEFLYHYAPGFNKFRGWSKFTYPGMLFLVMLAAIGFDALLRRDSVPRSLIVTTLGCSLFLFGAAMWGNWSAHLGASTSPQPWYDWTHAILYTGECLAGSQPFESPGYVQGIAKFASRQLVVAAITLFVLGGVLLLSRRRREFVQLILLIAIGEMLFFATSSLDNFTLSDPRKAPVAQYLASQPRGDYRILNLDDANGGMTTGARDLWGYDPGVLRRYAEWIAVTQNVPADKADQDIRFRQSPPIYASLLRCRYVFSVATPDSAAGSAGSEIETHAFEDAAVAPHVMIVPRLSVQPQRDDIFKTMLRADFDPRQTVILESPPLPAPASNPAPGKALVSSETTDSMVIEADLPDPAVLVITDAYSDGWHARSLLKPGEGSSQTDYRVMPADYCLRAIPLSAGHHRLILEYRPMAFVVGAWLTGLSTLFYIAFTVWTSIRSWRCREAGAKVGEENCVAILFLVPMINFS